MELMSIFGAAALSWRRLKMRPTECGNYILRILMVLFSVSSCRSAMSKYANHLIILLALLICMAVASCKRSSQNSAVHSVTAPTPTTSPNAPTEFERRLENELAEISNRARASVGIAVVHVERGRRAPWQGSLRLL